jgi:hypothetical protein
MKGLQFASAHASIFVFSEDFSASFHFLGADTFGSALF